MGGSERIKQGEEFFARGFFLPGAVCLDHGKQRVDGRFMIARAHLRFGKGKPKGFLKVRGSFGR